ncbi:phenoloxidase-activating factor 2 [Trichonephila clavata]|uniref:Phenoloxidase-activating factor 2 n=1 Tax=Trichonephila clavata TaxID=2740835 RepID=A0A8X6I0X5_TRICU|nr:phenoloxidase-activating factor 2 [Trichonephila clavata]
MMIVQISAIVTFALIGQILSLNYDTSNKLIFLSRSPALPDESENSPPNGTVTVLNPISTNPEPRRTGTPFMIMYPLTFPQSRNGKSLNLTLQSPQVPTPIQAPSSASSEEDQVQSRVMNNPELYPNFAFGLPNYNKGSDSMSAEVPQSSSDEYDDSNTPPIAPPQPSPPKQYNQKNTPFTYPPVPQSYNKSYRPPSPQPPQTYNKSYQPPSPRPQPYDKSYQPPPPVPQSYDKSYQRPPPPETQYKPKSPRYVPLPPSPSPPPQTYDKSIDYFPYIPRPQYNKTKNQPIPNAPPRIPTTTRKPNNVPLTYPYNKSTVPKYKILPLQAYNKATFTYSPSRVPPPTNKPKTEQQQYTPCICVPYYLCKNGIINSGGRLQAVQRRSTRSLKYGFDNRTLPSFPVQPKTSNPFINRQTSDSNVCQPNEVCCQIYFGGNTEDVDDGNYYPVATPPPEPSIPYPPRFPNKPKPNDVCGVKKVYGIQGRLKQLQYSADVSEFGEYPWQVAILKKVVGDKNLYLCGGVLISPQWIATVAHCIKKDKTSPLLVRLGEWDVNRKDESYPYVEKDVTTIVVHPDFDPESLENDLALIRMIDPVDARIPHITPACLPFPGQVFDNKKCWVSGWGKDFFGPKGEYQNVLKEVDVPVVSRAMCSTELRSTNLGPDFKLHPGFLCAGGEAGKDACTGDGGSPLVCTSNGLWYVVGLVSWGIGCGQPGIPGVYVNVLYYNDWINSIIRR